MKLFAFILSFLGFWFFSNAQEPTIRFQHLTPEDGLSQGHILCMLQDREGYVWMGTYYGLNRYNGYTFQLFSKDKNNPKSVISDVIYSLFEDKDGYIWVGTVSGLDRFDKKTETFEHIPTSQDGGLNDGYIHSIKQDKEGNIWVATNNGGLNKIDYKTHKVTHITTSTKPVRLRSNKVNDIHIDRHNNLWAATDGGGLSVINLKTNSSKNYIDQLTSFEKVTCIHEDGQGRMWIGNSDGKLASFNHDMSDFNVHTYLPDELKNRSIRIRDIAHDISGNILIATMGAGLIKHNSKTQKSQICLHNIYNSQTISSNEAYSILVDRSWTVFVGTYGRGVSRYSPYNLKFQVHYIETKDDTEGDINSYTSCVQDYKGRLIIGSYSGFFVYDKNTWQYKHYLPGKTYSENKILVITIAPDSTIWMGTNRGIHQYDKDLNKIRTFNIINDNLDHQVYSIFFDHLNNMWFGAFIAEGLFKVPETEWKNRKLTSFKYKHYKQIEKDSTSLYGNQVWSITEDKEKNLWIGTNIGICQYNYQKDNFKWFNITQLCKTIQFDKNNNMWIATRGEGIYFYNFRSRQIKHYTTENGLSQNFVFGVVPGSEEAIWFSSENGLSKFNPVTEKFRNYDIFDGLPNNRFDDRSEKLLPNGDIYMGTAKGFTIFTPESIKDDTSKARVVLTSLRISNKNIVYSNLLGKKNLIDSPIGQINKIELFPRQKDFSISFAALHFGAPHKIKYKYKLAGFDQQWIYTDAKNRVARYTNLDGGKYTFYVMATNGDGIWNETPLKVSVIVHPPFIKTLGFKILLLVFLAIIVFALFRWRIAREHKQNITLAKMVEERTLEISEKNNLLEKNALTLNENNYLLELRQKDIEDQKEELARQRDKLVELNATKDKLFSIIAHDLKNPFNVIIGFSDLMLANYYHYNDEKRKKIVTQINQASRIAFQLLENLLDWSRSQKGNLVLNPSQIEIADLLRMAVKQVKEFAKNKDILIKISKVDFNSTVTVDVNMMNTVLRNLLSNAVKFSENGTSIYVKTGIYGKTHLKISVQDHGMGMSQAVCQNLFRLDKNVSNVGTAGEKGTGLGLLICKDFVEAHKGKIWVESEEGKGSTFIVIIPQENINIR